MVQIKGNGGEGTPVIDVAAHIDAGHPGIDGDAAPGSISFLKLNLKTGTQGQVHSLKAAVVHIAADIDLRRFRDDKVDQLHIAGNVDR